MKKWSNVLMFCCAALTLAAARGHGSPAPNHGGQVQAVGETWLELVVKPNTVELYVEDDGEPLPSAQMTGKVIVVQGTRKTEYLLKPAGGNKLEAIGATASKGARVLTQLMLSDAKTKVAATFAIK